MTKRVSPKIRHVAKIERLLLVFILFYFLSFRFLEMHCRDEGTSSPSLAVKRSTTDHRVRRRFAQGTPPWPILPRSVLTVWCVNSKGCHVPSICFGLFLFFCSHGLCLDSQKILPRKKITIRNISHWFLQSYVFSATERNKEGWCGPSNSKWWSNTYRDSNIFSNSTQCFMHIFLSLLLRC